MNLQDWRPLPWQEGLWTQLQNSLRSERLAHALIFAGPPGVGKRHLVHGLTGALLCETPQAEGYACGRCRSCAQWGAGHHPNLMQLQPEEGKRDIAIDSVRALIARLGLSSHYGARKLAVLDPADALNPSGMNALLKTIEEPPPGSHIVLVTERLMSLTATLRSRCQILRCGAPPPALAEAWLAQAHPAVPAAQRREWVHAPLLMEAALADDARELRSKWAQLAQDAGQGRLSASLKALERIRKEEAEAFLRWMLQEGTRSLRAQMTGGVDDGPFSKLAPVDLQALLPTAVDGLRRIAGNAQPQLLLESLMIRIAQTRIEARKGERTR